MQPILIIAPHVKVYDIARDVAQNVNTVQVDYGLLEDAIPIALKAESEGAQVIISRGQTKQLLERSELTIPVVDIALSPFNMLSAIHKAHNFGLKITIMGSARILRGVEKLGKILNVDLEVHEIYNRAQAVKYVQSRMQSENPIRVLLGGAIAESLANDYGLPTVFLETSLENIEMAVEEASRLLEVRRLEAQKTEQLKAILDNINHGVIAVDKDGTITTFNKIAGKITGVDQLHAEGSIYRRCCPRTLSLLLYKPAIRNWGS